MGIVDALILGLAAVAMLAARIARPRADLARDRWERVLDELPQTPIGDARDGRVRVEGTAEQHEEVLASPRSPEPASRADAHGEPAVR